MGPKPPVHLRLGAASSVQTEGACTTSDLRCIRLSEHEHKNFRERPNLGMNPSRIAYVQVHVLFFGVGVHGLLVPDLMIFFVAWPDFHTGLKDVGSIRPAGLIRKRCDVLPSSWVGSAFSLQSGLYCPKIHASLFIWPCRHVSWSLIATSLTVCKHPERLHASLHQPYINKPSGSSHKRSTRQSAGSFADRDPRGRGTSIPDLFNA